MNHPYRWLAQYYDEVFSSSRKPIERGRRQILREILPKVKSGCDLACGTGTTAVELARKGIAMYGVDLSPAMRRLAREKARRYGLPVRVLEGDMRSFTLPRRVDLITCEYDALNHVPQHADLRKVARAVRRALSPGGYFFFDVNNALGFKGYWKGTHWSETADLIMVMRGGHSLKADRAWAEIDWFIRKGRCWMRRHERVDEVSWTGEAIRRTLRQEGFAWIRAWDATPFFGHHPLVKRGCRTFYLARATRD